VAATGRIARAAAPGQDRQAGAKRCDRSRGSSRWSPALFGNHRFSEIARNTGAPRDRLAARLRALVEAGVLEKRQYQDSPPRSGYHLTRAGRELTPVLQALLEWGNKWAVDEPPVTIRHHDHDLAPRTVCAACGEPVRQRDLHRVFNLPGWGISGPTADGTTGR
jgi:DNA-binding HxlR family transcriptional regulator